MFHMLIVVMVSQVHTCGKTSKIVHFKHVQLIICQLYFTKAVKIMQADRENRDGKCLENRKTTAKKRMLKGE